MRTLLSFVLAGGLMTATAFAQRGGPMGGQQPGLDPIMTKLFGTVKSFSAKMEMSMTSPQGAMTMSSGYEMLDGKIRMEIDMASIQSAQLPPEAMAQMKSMGMDRMVNISLPEKKLLYLIYPGLQSYAEMPIPQASQAADAGKEAKVDYAEVGKETIDGHPCVKSKMTVDTGDGKKREGFIWTATDLKGFPLQIQFDDPRAQMTMRFKDVQFKEPDAGRFVPPADFTKYNNPQEMMQGAMQKMMGAGGMPGMQPH
jgi:outer membrane lipoprotein-sorting protein